MKLNFYDFLLLEHFCLPSGNTSEVFSTVDGHKGKKILENSLIMTFDSLKS